ncbi:MAG: rnhA operon protein [Halanaeroarchaeum sp.]
MGEIPEDAVDEVERLTRLARNATDPDEADAYRDRREDVLEDHGYTARVREEGETAETLVLYPAEWTDDDGVVDLEAVDDLDRGIERRLAGRGEQGDWEEAEATNRDLVEAVRAEYGDVHAANAAAFADFMGNHYARPMETASETEIREFLSEYYPRNAWPTAEQAAVVERSLAVVFETADAEFPLE